MTTSYQSFIKENGCYLCFCENPILIKLTVGKSDFPANTTANEVIVIVEINGTEYKFNSEATNSSSLTFELRTAWVDEYAKTEISPSSYHPDEDAGIWTSDLYTVLKGKISYQLSYIQHNEFSKTYGTKVLLFDHVYALRGGVSEKDIMLNGWTKQKDAVVKFKNALSRMPYRPTVNIGDIFYQNYLSMPTQAELEAGTKVPVVTGSSYPIDEEAYNDPEYFAVNDAHRQEFRFINSFGVIESVSCLCLEQYAVNLKQTQHRITGTPSYVPGGYAKNVSSYTDKYKMSSGYMTSDWLEWFCKEFLNSPRHWMRIKGTSKILPVSVNASDNNAVYDLAKAELNEIQFDVTI